MPRRLTECKTCGRTVAIRNDGAVRVHNDGRHGANEAPQRCIRSGASPTADEFPEGGQADER